MKKIHSNNNPKGSLINKTNKIASVDFTSNIKNQKILKLISLVIPCGIILNYFYIHIKYTISFPFDDDFRVILNFLNNYILHHGIDERIKLIFLQHAEHRLAFVRVVALIEYYLLGQLNFRSFIIIGNSSLILTLIFLYKSFLFKHKVHILYLIPISFILFNLRFWEASFMAEGSMQELGVLCFVLLSLYYLFKESTYSIYLSMLFAWIATFTMGDGMLILFAGAFVLILNKEFFKYKKVLWFISGVVMIVIYFYGYVEPSDRPDIIKTLSDNPIGFLEFVFAFLGGAFTENIKYAIYIGIGLFLFIIYITIKKYYKENPIIYSFILFILITSILIALARFGLGLEQSILSRYTINSTLLVVCCYLAFVSMMYRKINLIYLIILTSLAYIFNYTTQDKYLPCKIAEKAEFDFNYGLLKNEIISDFNFCWTISYIEYPMKTLRISDSLGFYKFKYIEDSVLLKRIPCINTRKAMKLLKENIELNNHNSGSYINLLDYYEAMHDYDDAIKIMDTRLKYAPNNYYALNKKGYILFEQGKYKDAMKFYNKAIKLKPDYSLTYFYLADCYRAMHNYDNALRTNDIGLNYARKDPVSLNKRGYFLYVHGQYEEAVKVYNEVIKLKPYYTEAYLILAVCYNAMHNYDNATKVMDIVLKYAPDDYNALNDKGVYLCNQGKYKEAIKILAEAIKLKPNYTLPYMNLADCYQSMHDYDKAIKIMDIGLKYAPDDYKVYNHKGYILFEQGKYNEAVIFLRESIRLNPTYSKPYFNLADCYNAIHDYDNAIVYWEKSLEFNPNNIAAYKMLRGAYQNKGDKVSAEAYFAKAKEVEK